MLTMDDIMNFKIFLRSSSKTMANRKKEGKMDIQRFEYLENEPSFLDEMTNIFHIISGLAFAEKIKSS